MPGDVSRSSRGPGSRTPYVPSWCYPGGKPKECPCGHHEGYHNDKGECLNADLCGCTGIPRERVSTDDEFTGSS